MKHVFVSGNLALDLAGTLKWRSTEPEELLVTPADLDEWIAQSSIVDDPTSSTPDDLASAKRVREAAYAAAQSVTSGAPIESRVRLTLNELAAAEPVRPELTADGTRHVGAVPAVLSTLARAVIELVSGGSGHVVKECGRPTCTRIYVDRSRGARRTWCGMDECGNRIKAANYRARKKART